MKISDLKGDIQLVSKPTSSSSEGVSGLPGVAVGVTKGAASTGLGIGAIGNKIQRGIASVANMIPGVNVSPDAAGQQSIFNPSSAAGKSAREAVKPKTGAETAGFEAEHLAEWFIPASKALQAGGFTNVGAQFLTNASLRAAQTGGDLKDSLVAGALGATFAGIVPAAQLLKPRIASTLSYLSGFNSNVVEKALERTPGAVATAQGGEEALTEIVKRTSSKLSDYADNVLKTSRQTVKELSALSGGGQGYPGTRQALLDMGSDFTRGITSSLRNANIGVAKNGALNFSRSNAPSNIVAAGDKNAIQDAFNAVLNINKDTTIKNIDAVLERLMVLRSKTPVGSPTGAETRKIIGEMMDNVVGFTRSLSSMGKGFAKYADFLEDNLPKRVLINDAKELFGASRNLSPKETSQIATRLLQLYNTGKQPVREFAEDVSKKIGEDIPGAAAGALINTGDQFSARATELTQRGLLTRILEAIPREIVRSYVKTGNLTTLAEHPTITGIAKLLGTSAQAIAQEVAASIQDEPEP